jgi:hypothetical protein
MASNYNLIIVTDNPDTSISGVAESGTITIQLSTRNVNNGTVLPYTITGTGITAEDFVPSTLTGSFTVSSADGGQTGTASITLSIASDSVTEGTETAVVSLNNGQASIRFDIGDFSQTPFVEGQIIRITNYNDIRTKVVKLLGLGAVDFGYGQPVSSTAVTVSSKLTINEWTNLRNDIVNIWKHQYGTTPPLSTPAVNSIIRAGESIHPFREYDNYANILTANRFGIDSRQTITKTGLDPLNMWTSAYANKWSNTIFCTVTVTWTSATTARYFFNSGGEIRFKSSRTGGTNTAQNTSWTSLLSSAGTRAFGANKPGQGTDSPLNGRNWYTLTNSFQIWNTVSASAPYINNVYRILARTVDVANNSNGTSRSIQFRIEWVDNNSPLNISLEDYVDGTVSLEVSTLEARGTLEPAGAGLFSVESPTIVVGPIQEEYSISPNTTIVNEGDTVTFIVTTASIPNGTILYWTTTSILGTVNASDFTDNVTSGTVIINNNTGIISRTLRNDLSVGEREEKFLIQLKTGSISGTVVANSAVVTVNDTSIEIPSGEQIFTNTTADVSWVVPEYVESITVTGAGGGGGGGGSDGGSNFQGYGAGGGGSNLITRTYAVTPGQVLSVRVGGGGAGGFGGGNRRGGQPGVAGAASTVTGTGVSFVSAGGAAGTGGGNGGSGFTGLGANGANYLTSFKAGFGGGASANGVLGGTSTNGGSNGGDGAYFRGSGLAGQNGKLKILWG